MTRKGPHPKGGGCGDKLKCQWHFGSAEQGRAIARPGQSACRSPSTQIAQQNHTARKRKARAELGRTRSASEDMIWQSEMRRKGAAGGWEGDTQCSPQPPTCRFNLLLFHLFHFYQNSTSKIIVASGASWMMNPFARPASP